MVMFGPASWHQVLRPEGQHLEITARSSTVQTREPVRPTPASRQGADPNPLRAAGVGRGLTGRRRAEAGPEAGQGSEIESFRHSMARLESRAVALADHTFKPGKRPAPPEAAWPGLPLLHRGQRATAFCE